MGDSSQEWAGNTSNGFLAINPSNVSSAAHFSSLVRYLQTSTTLNALYVSDFKDGGASVGWKWTEIFKSLKSYSSLTSLAIVDMSLTTNDLVELSRLLFETSASPEPQKFDFIKRFDATQILNQHGFEPAALPRKLVLSELRLFNVWHSTSQSETEAAFEPLILSLAVHSSISSLVLFNNDLTYLIALDIISIFRRGKNAKALSLGQNMLLSSSQPPLPAIYTSNLTEQESSNEIPPFWAASPFIGSTLESLNLMSTGLTTTPLKQLLIQLSEHNCIRRLDLGYNPLDVTSPGLREAFASISSLRSLRVSGTVPSPDGQVNWLFDDEVMVSLEDIRMENCSLTVFQLLALMRSLSHNHILKTVFLDRNRMDSKIVKELAIALSLNKTLQTLSIVDCISVSPQVDTKMTSFNYLAFGLQNNFTLLDLSLFTAVGIESFPWLKSAPKNTEWFLEGLIRVFVNPFMSSNTTLQTLFGDEVLELLRHLCDSVLTPDIKISVETALNTLPRILELHFELAMARGPQGFLFSPSPFQTHNHGGGFDPTATSYFFHPPIFEVGNDRYPSVPSSRRSSWLNEKIPIPRNHLRDSTAILVDITTGSLRRKNFDLLDSSDSITRGNDVDHLGGDFLSHAPSYPPSRSSMIFPSPMAISYNYLMPAFPCFKPSIGQNVIRFNLVGLGLKGIPSGISLFAPQLQHLDLRGNQITHLSQELAKLTNLISLHLAHNQLDSVPFCILELTELRTLSLHRNPLRLIPWEIRENLSNPFQSVKLVINNKPPISCKLWDYLKQLQALANGSSGFSGHSISNASFSPAAPTSISPLTQKFHCRMMVFGEGRAEFINAMQGLDRFGKEKNAPKLAKTNDTMFSATSFIVTPSVISYFTTKHEPVATRSSKQEGRIKSRAVSTNSRPAPFEGLLSSPQEVEWMCYDFPSALEAAARLFMGSDVAYVLTLKVTNHWTVDNLEAWLNMIKQFNSKGKGNDSHIPFIYIVVQLLNLSHENTESKKISINDTVTAIFGRDIHRIGIHYVEAKGQSFVSEITQRVIASGMCLKSWHFAVEPLSSLIRDVSHTPKPIYTAKSVFVPKPTFLHPKQNVLPMTSIVALISHCGFVGNDIDKIVTSLEENGTILYFDRYPTSGFSSLLESPAEPNSPHEFPLPSMSNDKRSPNVRSEQDNSPNSMLSNLAVINLEYACQLFSRLMLLKPYAIQNTGIIDVSKAQDWWKKVTAQQHQMLADATFTVQKSPSGDSVTSIGSAKTIGKTSPSLLPSSSVASTSGLNHLVQSSPSDNEVDLRTFWALLEETGLAIRLYSIPILESSSGSNALISIGNLNQLPSNSLLRSTTPNFSGRGSSSTLALQMSVLDEESRAEYNAQKRRWFASIRSSGSGNLGGAISTSIVGSTSTQMTQLPSFNDTLGSLSTVVADGLRSPLLKIPEEDELSNSRISPSPSEESIASTSSNHERKTIEPVTRSRSKTLPSNPNSNKSVDSESPAKKGQLKSSSNSSQTSDTTRSNGPRSKETPASAALTENQSEYYFVSSLLPNSKEVTWTPLVSWVPLPVAKPPEPKPGNRKMALEFLPPSESPSGNPSVLKSNSPTSSPLDSSPLQPTGGRPRASTTNSNQTGFTPLNSRASPYCYYQRVYTFHRMPFGLFEHLLLSVMAIPGVAISRIHRAGPLLGAFEVKLASEIGHVSFFNPYRLFLDVAGCETGNLLTNLEAQILDTLSGWYPNNGMTHWVGYRFDKEEFYYERIDAILLHYTKTMGSYSFPLRSLNDMISEIAKHSPSDDLESAPPMPWNGKRMDVDLAEVIPDFLLKWTNLISIEQFESSQSVVQGDKKSKRRSARKSAKKGQRKDLGAGGFGVVHADVLDGVSVAVKSFKTREDHEGALEKERQGKQNGTKNGSLKLQSHGTESSGHPHRTQDHSTSEQSGQGLLVAMRELIHEVRILSLLGTHPNVVSLMGSVPLPPQIVLECLPGGALGLGLHKPSKTASALEKPETNPWSRAGLVIDYDSSNPLPRPKMDAVFDFSCSLRALIDTASAMNHLHSKGVLHRDLFIFNVLRTASEDPFDFQEPYAKIIDFGLARMVSARGETPVFKTERAWNIPPETRINLRFNASGDVFAFATLLYQLYTQCIAHTASEFEMVSGLRSSLPPLPSWPVSSSNLNAITNTTYSQLVAYYSKGTPFNKETLSNKFNLVSDPLTSCYLRLKALELYEQLLQDCWHQDPQQRPSFGGAGESSILFRLTIIFVLWTGVFPELVP